MVKDRKGRNWLVRYRKYRSGWHWSAYWKNLGQHSRPSGFLTRVLAQVDAQEQIADSDAVAEAKDYFQRYTMGANNGQD